MTNRNHNNNIWVICLRDGELFWTTDGLIVAFTTRKIARNYLARYRNSDPHLKNAIVDCYYG